MGLPDRRNILGNASGHLFKHGPAVRVIFWILEEDSYGKEDKGERESGEEGEKGRKESRKRGKAGGKESEKSRDEGGEAGKQEGAHRSKTEIKSRVVGEACENENRSKTQKEEDPQY